MPANRPVAKTDRLRGEVPKPLIIAAIVVIVGIVGAFGFYAYNGGWATQGQLDNKFKHEVGPIMAAKRGNTEALDAENELRKKNGQPLLKPPKDRHEAGADRMRRAEEARRQMEGRGAGN
jgi:hypothetical protein